MQILEKYSEIYGVSNSEKMFETFISNLTHTIYDWDFLVGWDKIANNMELKKEGLELLNKIIGHKNVKREFKKILKKRPDIIPILPILFAFRNKSVKLRHQTEPGVFEIVEYYFKKPRKEISDTELGKLLLFLEKSGVLSLFDGEKISNLKDYVFGVEVGLDSNARKNRGGNCMETAVEKLISDMCDNYGYEYLPQAGRKKIKDVFDYDVHVDIQDHIFDFVIKTPKKVILIETNFYSGGGGTLKRVCGEFQTMSRFIKENHEDAEFVWITDGLGWNTCRGHFEEAYNNLDYIFNLHMLENGLLEEIL